MILYNCASCPDNCDNADLPSVSFAECVDSLTSEESEIVEIFLSIESPTGTTKYKPTDWTDKDAWNAVINDSGSGIRRLIVIGNMPEPESTIRIVSKSRKKSGEKIYTINADIDDISATNYDFLRRLQCGATVVLWARTNDWLYGGPNGFSADVTKADPVLDRGSDSYGKGVFQFQWKSKCSPERIENPFDAAPIPIGFLFEDQFEDQFV